MNDLRTFVFKVAGRSDFKVEAISPVKAMGFANNHFGILPQGVWMESSIHAGVYNWSEGNFFD